MEKSLDINLAKSTKPRVIVNIQALRAIAALLIVGRHVGNPTIGVETHFFPHEPSVLEPIFGTFGGIGIDIFFVISGFIMMTTTWGTFGRAGASLTFFVRRLIRIYPPYWVALAPVVIGFILTSGHLMRSHVGMKMNLVADILLLPRKAESTLLGVSWTLSYEMFFYLVFAAVLLLPPKRIVPVLALWAVVQCCLYVAFQHSGNVLLAFLGSVLPLEFIAGALIGLIHVKGPMPFAFLTAIAALIGNGLLWLAFARYGLDLNTASQALRTVAILVPSALLVYSAVALETTKALRAPGWLIAIGNASYSLYLWHIAILFALGYTIERLRPHGYFVHIVLLSAMIAATVGFSLILYRFIERPLTSWLHRVLRARKREWMPSSDASWMRASSASSET